MGAASVDPFPSPQWIDWQASQGARALIEKVESKGADAVARFREAAVRETEKYREAAGIPMLQRARFTLAKRTIMTEEDTMTGTDVGGHVAHSGEGKRVPVVGTLQVSAEQSGRAFEVFVMSARPAGASGPAGPPPHVHRHRDELFYIIKGRMTFILGTQEVEVEQGGTVFVPRGTRHGFRPQPDSHALLIIAPAGLEGFFLSWVKGWRLASPTKRSAPPSLASTTPPPPMASSRAADLRRAA